MKLKEVYQKKIIPKLQKELGIKNKFAVPKIKKVVVNVGLGKALKDRDFRQSVEKSLKIITGQKPKITRAKNSISGFDIKKNMIVGEKVTLRNFKMYDFIGKIIHIALPRIRDFRGLDPKSLDKQGNLTIGFKEQAPFPEIKTEETEKTHGLEVTLITNINNRKKSLALFKALGFPFKA